MLVLTRKPNEEIWIGDSIRLVIVEIRGDKVKVGIEAPTEIPVHRGEVRKAIQAQADQRADRKSTDSRECD